MYLSNRLCLKGVAAAKLNEKFFPVKQSFSNDIPYLHFLLTKIESYPTAENDTV